MVLTILKNGVMEKKVIFIKLKAQVCQSIQYFEQSYESFINNETISKYYNFPRNRETSYLGQLTDAKEYYFYASVYEIDEDNNDRYISAFLGTGIFIDENKSLKITTKYKSEENNTITSLRKLSNLNIKQDFVDGEYVNIEESDYLFSQIDFILSDPYIPNSIERTYEQLESEKMLHPLAQRNEYCRRQYNLREPQEGRGEFQRDYERILHSKAFRRMVDKAQVFSASKGDYYRTRMTHSQTVAQIAKGIATKLNLNLNLTEAIALGHDIGHTPFGHQGERTLNDILHNKIPIIKNADLFTDHFGGFKHNYQSIRVASILEEEYFEINGMDLSYQTLEGMLKHTSLTKKDCKFELNEFITAEDAKAELNFDNGVCSTLEGQIVAVADEIAQRGHDLDDALSSGMMSLEEFKKYLDLKKLHELKERINKLFEDMNETTSKRKVFPDKNELMNSRVVSTVLSYFVNDVITTSKVKMDNYSAADFETNGYTVGSNKLIWFSDDAEVINQYLETLIANRVINSSEVSLFDNNGETIVASLFKAYYNNPRLIHKGTQNRIYAETRRYTQNVVNFELGNHDVISDEILKITKGNLSDKPDESEELSSELNEKYKLSPEQKEEYTQKRRILVRNICDYISGMTDTYAINEYRRIEKQL